MSALVLIGMLAALPGGRDASLLEVPAGFAARVYARDLAGARDLRIAPDGTLTLRGGSPREIFEITPPGDDSPQLVMRVAAELNWNAATLQTTALAAPMSLGTPVTDIPVAPEIVALARTLARQRFADVALGPDGMLYVSDARAGVVYQVRRMTL
jgi:hypothetical protein